MPYEVVASSRKHSEYPNDVHELHVANWSKEERKIPFLDLIEKNPPFATFFIGTDQSKLPLKRKFAQALCDGLNAYEEEVNRINVEIFTGT